MSVNSGSEFSLKRCSYDKHIFCHRKQFHLCQHVFVGVYCKKNVIAATKLELSLLTVETGVAINLRYMREIDVRDSFLTKHASVADIQGCMELQFRTLDFCCFSPCLMNPIRTVRRTMWPHSCTATIDESMRRV